MVINNDVWGEFNTLAKGLVKYKEDATIYDLFDTMRQVYGGQKYSIKYLTHIDQEIERENKYDIR